MAALSLAGCSDDENGNGGNGGNGGSGEGGNPSGGDLTEILFEDGTQIGDGRGSPFGHHKPRRHRCCSQEPETLLQASSHPFR